MKTKTELVLEAEIATLRAQLVAMDEQMTRGTDFGRMRAYEAALKLIAGNSADTHSAVVNHLRRVAAMALDPVESHLVFHGEQCRAAREFSARCALHRGHGGAHFDGVHTWSMKRRGQALATVLNQHEVEAAQEAWVAE